MLQFSRLVDKVMVADNHLKNSAVATDFTLKHGMSAKSHTSVILRYLVAFVICVACFSVNYVSALDLKHIDASNNAVFTERTDNEATANFILVVHPNDPINWAFRIRDTALDEEVFVDRLANAISLNHTIGKFINKFKPCIFSDDALVLQR